jgi:hypothetical protein
LPNEVPGCRGLKLSRLEHRAFNLHYLRSLRGALRLAGKPAAQDELRLRRSDEAIQSVVHHRSGLLRVVYPERLQGRRRARNDEAILVIRTTF